MHPPDGPPAGAPIGLALARAARMVSRAFEESLAAAGGSLPIWLVLLSLKAHPRRNQRELATAVGVREATLTHHLNAMDAAGLITRRRDPANRRVHLVELTPRGETLFLRLRSAAAAFDGRLRTGIPPEDLTRLEQTLTRLATNVT
jgi:MarR family transcriptional regulator, transcriptional regulator for hemolysin